MADTKDIEIRLKDQIIVGKFVDKERPTFLESMNEHFRKRLGDQYEPYEG